MTQPFILQVGLRKFDIC